jgi:hypothetical protein
LTTSHAIIGTTVSADPVAHDVALDAALAGIEQVGFVVEHVVHAVHEQVVGDEEEHGADHK